MAALPFQSGRGRGRKRPSPSLTTIAAVTALAAGVAYLILPAGIGVSGRYDLMTRPPASSPAQAVAVAAKAPAHTSTDPPPAAIAGTVSAIDGDTLQMRDQRIRLEGVDAPEARQQCLDADGKFWRCGQAAANALDDWIAGNPLSCKTHGREKWGRVLATCTVRGESVQAWLVSHGYAIAYRRYSTAYVAAEDKAREEKIGVWVGEFIPPSDWRKGLRLAGETPTKAMIDGKVAAK